MMQLVLESIIWDGWIWQSWSATWLMIKQMA